MGVPQMRLARPQSNRIGPRCPLLALASPHATPAAVLEEEDSLKMLVVMVPAMVVVMVVLVAVGKAASTRPLAGWLGSCCPPPGLPRSIRGTGSRPRVTSSAWRWRAWLGLPLLLHLVNWEPFQKEGSPAALQDQDLGVSLAASPPGGRAVAAGQPLLASRCGDQWAVSRLRRPLAVVQGQVGMKLLIQVPAWPLTWKVAAQGRRLQPGTCHSIKRMLLALLGELAAWLVCPLEWRTDQRRLGLPSAGLQVLSHRYWHLCPWGRPSTSRVAPRKTACDSCQQMRQGLGHPVHLQMESHTFRAAALESLNRRGHTRGSVAHGCLTTASLMFRQVLLICELSPPCA